MNLVQPISAGFILALLACLAATPVAKAASDDSAARPNIIVILADDMGYSDAGCYGGEIQTPNLDSLAANGLRFTQFYNTARCWPSRAVIMTGYYAQQVRRDAHFGTGRRGGQGQRPAWAPLLPALLKSAGYRSYHSGKWHIDGKQLDGGFDRSYSLEDHDRFFYPKRHTQDDQKLPPVERGTNYYATTHIANHAIECLQEHASEHPDRPFLSYIAFTSPHFPLHALQEDIDKYRTTYLQGWNKAQQSRGQRMKDLGIIHHDPPQMERELGPPYDFPKDLDKLGPGEIFRPLPWNELTETQQEFQATKMAIHAAMVDRMDQEIGRVISQLKQMNAFENTLILFASDNGASAEIMVRGDSHNPDAPMGSGETFLCLGPGFSSLANTPHRRHKTWVHEGGISTELIAHWPKGITSRGELRHTPGHLIDIVPTVLDVAGTRAPEEWQGEPVPKAPGHSLVPLFKEDGTVTHEELWWCHDNHRALRLGDWKIVASNGEPWELYDLSKDRGESTNLATAHPEKVTQLERRWNELSEQFQAQSAQ
ncbi:MAG: arylsulfatase [Planctomycetaceae bacterium]|nr:arylsulfatase [Planctomycetaceae bacterium]